MPKINPRAQELNEIIKKNNLSIYSLLSEKGKAIFFPKKGILNQTAQAKTASKKSLNYLLPKKKNKPSRKQLSMLRNWLKKFRKQT